MKKINSLPIPLSTMVRIFIVIFCACVPLQQTYAQVKVVVIPMVGDDILPEPTAPIAKVDPSQTDYTLMVNTTIDNITGLEWQREDDNDTKTWNEALDYCADLDLDSKTDWRLPDIIELQSIVDYGQTTAPIIDGVAFPNTNSSDYWSASSRAAGSAGAWRVFFGGGNVGVSLKANSFFVRCVR